VVAVIMVALHSLYEWILISFYAQYMLAITAGLIVGIAQQMNQFSRSSSMRVVRVQAPEKEPLVAQH
jgi:hypothetical protein